MKSFYIIFSIILFLGSFQNSRATPDNARDYDTYLQSILDSCLFYRNTDVSAYEKEIGKLLVASAKTRNKYYETAGLIEHAFLNIIQTDYTDALDKLTLAIGAAKTIQDENLVIDGLTFKGIAEKELFEYGKAIETFREIMRRSAHIGRLEEVSGSAHMIAEIYKSGNDLDEAYKYYLQGKAVPNADGSPYESQGWWYLNFSDYHLQRDDFEKSIAYCDSSLMIWDKLDMVRGKGYSLNHMGEIYRLKNSPNCIAYFSEALEQNSKMNNKSEMLRSKVGLGNYYASNPKTENTAADWFQKSITFSADNDLNHLAISALDFFIDRPHLMPKYSIQLTDLMERKIEAQQVIFRKNSRQGIQLAEAKLALANSINDEQIAKQEASSFKRIIALLILIGTISGAFVILLIRAFTKLNASQSQIKTLNEELNNNLTNLQEKKIQLEYVNETRSKIIERLKKFSAVLSHDLKEPVRTINSFGNLIKRNQSQNLSDKELKYINYMTDGALRIHNMINTLYKYSNNTLVLLQAFSDVDLDKLVKDVKSDFSKRLEEQNAVITSDHLGSIEGQEVLLYQLFQNIISNALKYQKPNISPKVDIRVKQLEDNQLQISFEDNGIGIPTENQDDIFDMFKRANNVDSQSGHGIGLSTCKEIVEIHNGKIWLDSVENLGTTIHIILPLYMYISSESNVTDNDLLLT